MRRGPWWGVLVLVLVLVLVVGWSGIAIGAEPDPEEVRRLMEKYEQKEPVKQAPAPKPRLKPEPVSKPQPKAAPTVDHDREAWQSAEKCGTAACFEAYLADYPKGRYARMAKAQLKSGPTKIPTVNISTVVSGGLMQSDDYQHEFNKRLKEGFYPLNVNGKCQNGLNLYQADWVPLPLGSDFISHHGIDEATYNRVNQKYSNEGYSLQTVNSFQDCSGFTRYQATWLKNHN